MLSSELRKMARKNREEILSKSVIPKSYWESIETWLGQTGLGDVYLDAYDAIGAWWAAKEADRLGYTINFIRSGCVPSRWFPDGENWNMAKAEAKYQLTKSWAELIEKQALVKK